MSNPRDLETPRTDAVELAVEQTDDYKYRFNHEGRAWAKVSALSTVARRLERELRQARGRERECAWTEDLDGNWESSCGQYFGFNDGGPEENNFNFCHGCGHPVQAVKYVDPPIDNEESALPSPPEK